MDLTAPVLASDIRAAFPRDTRAMEDAELDVLLELEETALRAQFGVSATDATTDLALSRAMRIGWPSFLQQTRQVAQEQTGADSHNVTYNRSGVIDFEWPASIAAILAPVSDAAAAELAAPTRASQTIPLNFVW